jgi:cytochrome c peroxidase
MKLQLLVGGSLIALLLILACKKEPVTTNRGFDVSHLDVIRVLNLPYNTIDYNKTKIPGYLEIMGLKKPTLDNEQVTLGRVLFYDKSLSADEKISCASCHQQGRAFSDPTAFSKGVNGRVTSRNSPGLANVVHVGAHYQGWTANKSPFFWDQRAQTIAEQSRQTIQNPDEMGMDLQTMVQRVASKPYYQVLFRNVYPDGIINEERVMQSLEQFVLAIPASQTKFDKAMNAAGLSILDTSSIRADTLFTSFQIGDTTIITTIYYSTTPQTIIVPIMGQDTVVLPSRVPIPQLNDQEQIGAAIFVANCSSCHSPIRPFQNVFSANIGLDINYKDQGLGATSGRPQDQGVFKAPPLRNIEFTAPYMHDGRFNSLDEVINFYSTGIKPHPNLHPLLKSINGNPKRLNLTPLEKISLKAFLLTLTDKTTLTDGNFSNPFK